MAIRIDIDELGDGVADGVVFNAVIVGVEAVLEEGLVGVGIVEIVIAEELTSLFK